MLGESTKDSLGGFVERFIPLFIAEIKFFIETNSEEMKSRVLQLDHNYTIEDLNYL